MHEKDGAHDKERERLEVPHHLFPKRRDVDATAAVGSRMRHYDLRRDRFQLGARLFDRDAFLYLADAIEEEATGGLSFSSIYKGIQMSQISGKRQSLGMTPTMVTCLPLIAIVFPTTERSPAKCFCQTS